MFLSWSRAARVGILVAAATAVIAILGLGPAIHNRIVFGEFYTAGAPPRVDYCGRRYYPGNRTETLVQVNEFLAENNLRGLTRIETTPSGMPVLTNVLSAAQKAEFSTSVCTMALWVQTGPDAYVGYGLSGGP